MEGFNPQVYIIFILVIPNIKTYILFLLAFFMGIAIDIFSGTGGIHSSSLLFLAAFRHPLLRRINLKTIDDEYKLDNLSVFNRSLFFAIICIFHSLLIHFFNTVNFKNALDTVVNSLLDAFLTWVFVLLIFPWVQFPTKKEEFGRLPIEMKRVHIFLYNFICNWHFFNF